MRQWLALLGLGLVAAVAALWLWERGARIEAEAARDAAQRAYETQAAITAALEEANRMLDQALAIERAQLAEAEALRREIRNSEGADDPVHPLISDTVERLLRRP